MTEISPNKIKSPKIVFCTQLQKWVKLTNNCLQLTPLICPHSSQILALSCPWSQCWVYPVLLGDGECLARPSFTVCCLCFTVSALGRCALCKYNVSSQIPVAQVQKAKHTPGPAVRTSRRLLQQPRGSVLPLAPRPARSSLPSVPLCCLDSNRSSFPRKLQG